MLYAVGLFTAILTGFYIFRLIFGVFFGAYRGGAIAAHGEHGGALARAARGDPLANVHEVGPAMMIPMVVLGVLSVIGGFYGTPWADAIGTFLEPSTHTTNLGIPTGSGLFWLAFALGLVTGPIGIAIAWARYARREPKFAASRNPLVALLDHQYYIDNLYDAVFVRPVVAAAGLWRIGLEGGLLRWWLAWRRAARRRREQGLRRLQTGYARNYALAIFVGAALILVYLRDSPEIRERSG